MWTTTTPAHTAYGALALAPSLHTAGIITYYQNTPPTYRQKPRETPKFHQGDSTSHPECSSHGDHTHSSGYSIETLHYILPTSLRTTKTRPLRTDRSHEGSRNPTRKTPLVTLNADHLKPRGPHPLQRIQHRDPSLHTAGITTYYQTHPLRTDRSYKGPQNPTRETPLVTLDADHSKSRGPHPLRRIQHRDPSLHTSGKITYYQNTTPTYRQKPRGTPKSLQGDSTS